MFEVIIVAYFVALAIVAIFRNNADYIKHEIILKDIPDSIIRILPTMEEEEIMYKEALTHENVIELAKFFA